MASKISVFSLDSNPNIDQPARRVKRSIAQGLIRRGLAVLWRDSLQDGILELEAHTHTFDPELLRPVLSIMECDGGALLPPGPPRGLLISYPLQDQRT